ncbi:MAG TPA: DJ-1/PfpI family protein [Solirubrobacteraceae bacterium]|nr:DJ-1/PfpI family protein [Solirubrobacteraceae bacterium]
MQIAIPLYERFTALDAIGPYDVLARLPGAEVAFVAAEPGVIRTEMGEGGPAFLVQRTLDDVPAPDIVVVPGGFGNRALLGDSALVRWLRAVHPRTTWTTSVCTGSLLLAAAGILDGEDAATHWLSHERLEGLGARPSTDRVVRRGKVITAAGVSSGIDMALTLAAEIAGPEVAQGIQLAIEYDPQPPFDAGAPHKAPVHIVSRVREVMGAQGTAIR